MSATVWGPPREASCKSNKSYEEFNMVTLKCVEERKQIEKNDCFSAFCKWSVFVCKYCSGSFIEICPTCYNTYDSCHGRGKINALIFVRLISFWWNNIKFYDQSTSQMSSFSYNQIILFVFVGIRVFKLKIINKNDISMIIFVSGLVRLPQKLFYGIFVNILNQKYLNITKHILYNW